MLVQQEADATSPDVGQSILYSECRSLNYLASPTKSRGLCLRSDGSAAWKSQDRPVSTECSSCRSCINSLRPPPATDRGQHSALSGNVHGNGAGREYADTRQLQYSLETVCQPLPVHITLHTCQRPQVSDRNLAQFTVTYGSHSRWTMIPVVTVVAFTLMGGYLSKQVERVEPSCSCARQVLKGSRTRSRTRLKTRPLTSLSVRSGFSLCSGGF